MNAEDRSIAAAGYTAVMRRIENTPRFRIYQAHCMEAIAGAGALLGRDPEELARQMADGRLAYYILDGEKSIPLPLDDPEPIQRSLRSILNDAAAQVDEARERLASALIRIESGLDKTAQDFRQRARRADWRPDWP